MKPNRQNVSTFNVHIHVRALEIPSEVCAEENHELSYIALDENASLRGLKPRALTLRAIFLPNEQQIHEVDLIIDI